MNTTEYATAALGKVTNFHDENEKYLARKAVKAGVTTHQLATNIRPGEKGGLAIDWVDATESEFNRAVSPKSGAVVTGSRVERINSSRYDNGRTGSVVEVNAGTGRARVFWDGDKRTWVAFRFLKVIA